MCRALQDRIRFVDGLKLNFGEKPKTEAMIIDPSRANGCFEVEAVFCVEAKSVRTELRRGFAQLFRKIH